MVVSGCLKSWLKALLLPHLITVELMSLLSAQLRMIVLWLPDGMVGLATQPTKLLN